MTAASISFNQIPNNVRIPAFMVEFDSTAAVRGAQYQPYKALILGQMLATGTADALTPYRVNNKSEADAWFGRGSMISAMVDYYRRNDTLTELYAIAVPDNGIDANASATVTITGAPVAPGVLNVYINGQRFTVTVRIGDTLAAIAAAFVIAVNALPDLPVTATSSAGVVTLTARHPGLTGNDIDLRFNYNQGEYFPTGVTVVATAFAGGVENPDVTSAVAAVKGDWFNAWILPYVDLNNISVITADLEERWGPLIMQEGWVFMGKRGTHGELGAFGDGQNSKCQCIMNAHGIPNAPYELAAAVAANAMYYGNIDPARPFQTLPLVGVKAPPIKERFADFPENNQLLYDGISTFNVGDDGVVRIGRLITTYKKNDRGADDTSYLDLNTGLTLGYLRWDFRNHMLRKFPRHKLGNDGVRYNV